jgi:DNA-binding MltR family transcriptional regulator
MEKPWMTGPKELLVHGIYHLKQNTDFDIRMSMICIDNSVELMIKTYLGLPKRVTKIENLSRTKYNEVIQSFPKLIDALEEYCSDKLLGIDLGDIEWFHRLRNELYHNGNGVTVEKTKVLIYAEIAKNLFSNLYGIAILEEDEAEEINDESLVGEYITNWIKFEKLLNYENDKHLPPFKKIRELFDAGKINEKTYQEFVNLNKFRNELVHGQKEPEKKSLKLMNSILNKSVEVLQHII